MAPYNTNILFSSPLFCRTEVLTTFYALILGHLFNGATLNVATELHQSHCFKCRDSGFHNTFLPFIGLTGKLAPESSKATTITENFSVARKYHRRPEHTVKEDQLVSLTNCLEAKGLDPQPNDSNPKKILLNDFGLDLGQETNDFLEKQPERA